MRNIESMVGRDLNWVRPGIFKRSYELHAGDIVVATLGWSTILSMEAKAESADGCCKFARKGIWKTEITVTQCEHAEPLVTFMGARISRNQKIDLPGGKQVFLKTNFWRTRYTLETDTREPLAIISRERFFSGANHLELRRRGTSYAEFPWLVLLMWYLILLARRRAQAHAAAG